MKHLCQLKMLGLKTCLYIPDEILKAMLTLPARANFNSSAPAGNVGSTGYNQRCLLCCGESITPLRNRRQQKQVVTSAHCGIRSKWSPVLIVAPNSSGRIRYLLGLHFLLVRLLKRCLLELHLLKSCADTLRLQLLIWMDVNVQHL